MTATLPEYAPPSSQRACVGAADVAEPTRDFVQRFLAAERVLLLDGQRP